MPRIFEIKESTFVGLSLSMILVLAAFVFKAGQAYNRLDNVESGLNALSMSVNACLTSCRSSVGYETLRPIVREATISPRN